MKNRLTERAAKTGSGKLTRLPWITPKVDKIEAGQAEVGTRAAADGAFSTS